MTYGGGEGGRVKLCEEFHKVISALELLQHPAHLAVFLNYVISNSDPNPLLFFLITGERNYFSDRNILSKYSFQTLTRAAQPRR